MRSDMKDVIIDTGRRGRGYSRKKKTQATDSRLEDLPEKEGMKRRWDGWGLSFGDRIQPLTKWLRKQVGRPLDKIYSEFCEHADARSLRGWHARDHFWMEVQRYSEYIASLNSRWRLPGPFYEDEHGLLREHAYDRYRYRPKVDKDKCECDGRRFERINDCWFEVWYKKTEEREKYWSFLTGRHEYRTVDGETKVRQRQLGKKDLKTLGLSNVR